MKIHSVKFNFFMNLLSTGMSYLFPLITFPYVARVLTSAGYGSAEYAISTAQLFSLVAMLGANYYGTRECAKVRENPDLLSKTAQEIFVITTISTAFVIVLYAVFVVSVPAFNSEFTVFVVAGFTIPLTTIGVQWFLNANEQYAFMAVRNLLVKIAVIVFMFILVRSSDDVVAWVSISVCANGAANIANFIYMQRSTRHFSLRKLAFKKHLKPILLFFLVSASISIYTSLDTVMLGFMSSTDAVAFYRVPVKIKGILVSVMTALSGVIMPRASYLIMKGDKERFNAIMNKSVHFAIIFGLYSSMMVIVFSEPIISLLAGAGYGDSIIVLCLISPAVLFISLTQITANQLLAPLGYEKTLSVSYVLAGIFDFVMNTILIPQWGACGAAVSTTLAELLVLVVQVVYLNGVIDLRRFVAGWYRAVVPVALSGLLAKLLYDFLGQGNLSAILTLFLSFLILISGLIVFRETLFTELIVGIINKQPRNP